MKNTLFVGLGGFIGSILRYLIGLINFNLSNHFPLKTLGINIFGSFIIGIISFLSIKHLNLKYEHTLFLKVGLCGGFTTFSTFSYETYTLIEKGNYKIAVIYSALSVILGVLAVFTAQIISDRYL